MVVMEDYSDVHRATVQTVMNKGTIEEDKLKIVFGEIWKKFKPDQEMNENDLSNIIDSINERIRRFDHKIVKYHYGLDCTQYYIFCSTAVTSTSKMQQCFTQHEIDFFKTVLTTITENDDLAVSPREVLNLTSTQGPGKVTKVRAEELLDIWCSNGYFVRHANMIFIGPKAVTEFKEDLKAMQVEHLRVCGLCDDIALWGITCQSCKTSTYHENCIEKFLARFDKCPSCKAKWIVPMEE